MDGANADSDHSMTWEDFFGSTTDLTPTLIGIYDSLLEPAKSPEVSRFDLIAKDARNDPPLKLDKVNMIEEYKNPIDTPNKGVAVKLPVASVNRSSLYSIRTKVESERDVVTTTDPAVVSKNNLRAIKTDQKASEVSTFDNLSPNVKRMISSATETTGNPLKFQKRTATVGRSSGRGHRSNIPLVGATSKITQSRVELPPSVEIYDQPLNTFNKSKSEEPHSDESPSKIQKIKPEFKLNVQETYDVPTNNRSVIYDVPLKNSKTAFESLSLPYIDQSIELSISSNDREFDIKLSSKENSPEKAEKVKSPEGSPLKLPRPINGGTNSLNRKDFNPKPDSPSKQLAKTGPYPEAIGSTGNLKAVPEKELPRLNPPTVEVSRPLSMSSIASSSSTSSSGVQNKGGVNSAYLASIESLDDHSDADVTSRNGSNIFVNNAGMMNQSVSEERHSDNLSRDQPDDVEMSGLSQLELVCAEIVHTENVYVQDLQQVVEGYLHEWKREMTFSEEELSEVFNNIEDIYTFNRSLCEELNTCRLDATCIARCFVNNTSGFSVYTSYCTGYPRTMARLAALASEPRSAREFRERQLALGHPLPLASYLLKPVQRLLKYHLLLQNVVKQCASRETEYALLKMTGIAQHIDDMKRRHEHAVRVQEIQSLLYGWNGPDLTTYGELCAEGTFRVFGAKAMRHAFLFDKMLLITKNREDGILAYKMHIMCNNMMLVESIAGAPLSFHVIPWDSPRSQLTLQARSPRHKREWTLLLKRVILENYNVVIPSHARQILMELGQNKTDDDMLAEKSHNLITQASMRKQLSAPEYLEKRKLERERRKSFENGIRGRLKKVNRKYTMPVMKTKQECDCAQVSLEKGIDYTCDSCYIDLCSDCEVELSAKDKKEECSCRHELNEGDKCAECDRALHFIDAGSTEHIERKNSVCKCSDFKSSQESFSKDSLNKTRGYHSSDNIVGYTDNSKSKDDLTETNNFLSNVRNLPKTCLKCAKIKENIVMTDSTSTLHSRRSRCIELEKQKADTLRSKSKEDPQRSKLSKIGTWRRKSEPGLQQNPSLVPKRFQDSDSDRPELKGIEKIEFECRNCGSTKINKKGKTPGVMNSDPELESRKPGSISGLKPSLDIKVYTTKNIPKKISKLKKNRAKGKRFGSDTTAKFYADLSTDVSTENILHITESTDSLVDKTKGGESSKATLNIPESISKDDDIDEETYKKLIEKTDSFKKNELEKVKYLNKQNVINEGSEIEGEKAEIEVRRKEKATESCEETEQPLEQIISQLLMQNREFQKILKKQQLRNSAQRRHQRLLKSHSNPEHTITSRTGESKNKPKYSRQLSENLDLTKVYIEEKVLLSPPQEKDDISDDDHIYETLRVENRAEETLHSLDSKSKSIQHTPKVSRPKRLPSPPNPNPNLSEITPKVGAHDSDYVYLSFDKLNKLHDDVEGIYDVPIKSPQKVQEKQADYYVTMENNGPMDSKENIEDLYDNIIEVCRRRKDSLTTVTSDYLPMGPEQQSPNTPEIWLSRQKEHFNVSRDRKSGSLPRSFQVPVNNPEEANLSTFKSKPNSNSKSYLNKDGKVMSNDRPFTIASDQSEISYDDVENYMSEGDILKFNKNSKSNDGEIQNISQSTLELEEEIDRCYKNNFEANLDSNKNSFLLNVSQPNLDISTTSSCEVLPANKIDNKQSTDMEVIHPEHKIYKPTGNMLSLKNVLSRFKSKIPNKGTEDSEVSPNDPSSPDSTKSDPKSPTTEKKSGLNPRSYSKNLLQRFRSIIGDEHPDDNLNRSVSPQRQSKKLIEELQNNLKNDIKVVITATEASPTISSLVYSTNDALSQSTYENTTLTDSQNEKNNLDVLSHSCNDIAQKSEANTSTYEKSVSLVTNISNSVSSTASQSKSNNSSYQSLNKLPIYMQGSKHLGARIAQSDYVDPTTLMSEKAALKNVNILINKNAVRPDSLFSNSSFVTSSSEGTYQEGQNRLQNEHIEEVKEPNPIDSAVPGNADESYYEKTFEKIEHVIGDDVFRDSAVYSDQEDADDGKIETIDKTKHVSRTTSKVESIKRESSFRTQKTSITSSVTENTTLQRRVLVTTSKFQHLEKVNLAKENTVQTTEKVKPKVAPPVPAKPKITSIPTTSNFHTRNVIANRSNLLKTEEKTSSSESVNIKTIKRNTNMRQSYTKSESISVEDRSKTQITKEINSKEEKESATKNVQKVETEADQTDSKTNEANKTDYKPKTSNIQLKRLSFERASLDSATRKTKPQIESKRLSVEPPKVTSKTVQERRMEIESMTKTVQRPSQGIKKPSQIAKPKSMTTKVSPYERSVSEMGTREVKVTKSVDSSHIPSNDIAGQSKEIELEKGSWVKTVVNKFQ